MRGTACVLAALICKLFGVLLLTVPAADLDCCRPALVELSMLLQLRIGFLYDAVPKMEKSHSEAAAEMLALCLAAGLFKIGAGGAVGGPTAGQDYWVPRGREAQLTEAFPNAFFSPRTAGAMVIASTDHFVSQSQPYTAVLPAAVLEIVEAEPTSELSASYCRWFRTAVYP